MFYKQTVFITGITFLAITGHALGLEQLYFMAAVLGFLMLGSYVLSRQTVRGLQVARGRERKIYEGERCDLTLSIANTSRLPKLFLSVHDTLPQWLQPVGEGRTIIPVLLPGRSLELTFPVRAVKRGAYRLGPTAVSGTDPLGVFPAGRNFDAQQEMIVYPLPVPVYPDRLAGIYSLGGAETEQLSAAASGSEFYGIREYAPGDALRRIHWPSTARMARLHVLEFEETVGAEVVVVLDLQQGTHAGEGRHTTLEAAIKAAASLAAFALDSGASATVVGRDARGAHRVVARRADDLPRLLEALARMEADGEAHLAQVMASVEDLVTGRTAVLVTALPDRRTAEAVSRWAMMHSRVQALIFDRSSFDGAAGDVYQQAGLLRAAGASVEVLRRDDSLEGALGRAITDGN